MSAARRRAVVTGIGVIAPNGVGTEAWWEATRAAQSGIRRISRFDPSRYGIQLGGEVEGFEPAGTVDQRLMAQTDRSVRMALTATEMALADAGFDPSAQTPSRMGVVTATCLGGSELTQQEMQNLWEKGPASVGAYQSTSALHAAAAGQISIKHGLKGSVRVVSAEGAGGLEAMAQARQAILRGMEAVVGGGTEAPITPYALTGQWLNGNLSWAQDPADAYRPFDAAANGYVPGEGAAFLLVEDLEHAQRRGASHLYGEILGYGATHDAYHYARPAPDGRQFSRAISLALQDAAVDPHEVDAIFADAAGTPESDALEAKAIAEIFGARGSEVLVTAPKAMVGRLYAAGAVLDVAAALLAMRDQCLPPIVNLDQPGEGYNLNLVTGEARSATLHTVLVNARGVGGFNSALVLRRVS